MHFLVAVKNAVLKKPFSYKRNTQAFIVFGLSDGTYITMTRKVNDMVKI